MSLIPFRSTLTTNAVMAQFRKTLTDLESVKEHHTQLVEQEDARIEEAMRRRSLADAEVREAVKAATKLQKLFGEDEPKPATVAHVDDIIARQAA